MDVEYLVKLYKRNSYTNFKLIPPSSYICRVRAPATKQQQTAHRAVCCCLVAVDRRLRRSTVNPATAAVRTRHSPRSGDGSESSLMGSQGASTRRTQPKQGNPGGFLLFGRCGLTSSEIHSKHDTANCERKKGKKVRLSRTSSSASMSA